MQTNNVEYQIILVIAISVVTYTLINLKGKFFSLKMLVLIGASAFVALGANKNNPTFSVSKFLLAIPVCFTAGVGGLFQNELLPAISIWKLHLISLIYSYCIIINTPLTAYFNLILIIPVAIVFYYLLLTRPVKYNEKVVLYCINIGMLIIIEYYNLKRIALFELPADRPEDLDLSLILTIFFITGILFYIIIYIMNLFWIIPIPAKDESNKEMKTRIKFQAELFERKVSDKKAPFGVIVLSTAIIFIFLIMNSFYHVVPHNIITDISVIILLTFWNKIKKLLSYLKARHFI
jgi:hypothetical protein